MDSSGRIAGTYLHGFFDTPSCRSALRRLLSLPDEVASVVSSPEVFDRLADWLEQHLLMDKIMRIVGLDG